MKTDRIKISVFGILTLIASINNAQDTIILNDNSYYHGKVIEVSTNEILFRNNSNNNNQINSIDIFSIKGVKYENGMYENYLNRIPKGYYLDNNMNYRNASNGDVIKIGEKQMLNKMLDANNEKIDLYMEESRRLKRSQKHMIAPTIGFAGGAVGFAALATLIEFGTGGGSESEIILVASGACFVMAHMSFGASFYFNAKGKNNKKAAIKKYNELYSNTY